LLDWLERSYARRSLTEEALMAMAFIQEFPIVDGDTSTTNYDAVVKKLDLGNTPVPGLIAHSAGFDTSAGVFRIFDIWENGDDAKHFYEGKLQPILDEMMAGEPTASPPQREATYELHDVIH
jgi:hypothetical protein